MSACVCGCIHYVYLCVCIHIFAKGVAVSPAFSPARSAVPHTEGRPGGAGAGE